MKLAKIILCYFLYSIIVGYFLEGELNSALGRDVYSLIAGPSIVFGRSHGAEFYILATFMFLPLFYIFSKNFQKNIRIFSGIALLLIWIAFSVFLK